MPLVNAGRDHLANAAIGVAVTAFNNANARIGVGNSTTNTTPLTYTDLQGASKTRKGMDAGYPTNSTANILIFRSTFDTGEANHAWDEFGIFNAGSGGTMLCRKVQALGTKTSAESWQITATITVSA